MKKDTLKPILDEWLDSCIRVKGNISRNTVAVGIVILDHLSEKCPLEKSEIVSKGGEISGTRGTSLRKILGKYKISEKYLKEATTRQVHQDGQRLLDAVKYGKIFGDLKEIERKQMLQEGIYRLRDLAFEWLKRQNLKIDCDRQNSPAFWIGSILESARGRSGGKVEQHLVGAKLEYRHPNVEVPNFPGHAADAQTKRPGDFAIGTTCYHVTATPGRDVVQKCNANLKQGFHPVLLVPRNQVEKARHIAEDQGMEQRMTILGIEDFIALNIIEMSVGEQQAFVDTLKKIVEKYNRRLEEVETDLSLKIDLK